MANRKFFCKIDFTAGFFRGFHKIPSVMIEISKKYGLYNKPISDTYEALDKEHERIKDLEADLKESRLLYKEAKEEIDRLKDEYGEFREYHHYKIMPKLERYETALRLFEEYCEFVNDGNEGAIVLAYNHGWRADQKVVEKGKEYRRKLGIGEFKKEKTNENNQG